MKGKSGHGKPGGGTRESLPRRGHSAGVGTRIAPTALFYRGEQAKGLELAMQCLLWTSGLPQTKKHNSMMMGWEELTTQPSWRGRGEEEGTRRDIFGGFWSATPVDFSA